MKTLDEQLDAIADQVEELVRRELKPPDDCYYRVYLKALVRILRKRSTKR
jgi:hypothetical protein